MEISIGGAGIQTRDEKCDDGNKYAGDGCSDQCQIEAGFALLKRAEAEGLLPNSHNEGYPMLHNLIQACHLVGDFDSVSRVQAAMDRLGLITLAPVATAVVQGSLRDTKMETLAKAL